MDNKTILQQSREIGVRVTGYRRHLHANAELSFNEHATADYIAGILDEYGIAYDRIAGTGILAKIEGTGDLKKAVVLRADTDALPIEEQTGLPFASTNNGAMHACGHDMHTAALLGAMIVLGSNRSNINGTVFGLFQPGEELCPGGASLVLREKPFDGYEIEAFIGEHVDPELPTGVFGFRAGKYMASSDEIRITVRGEGGHAAMPQKLKDPVVAAAAIITALQQVVSRNDNPGMPTVLSVGKLQADGATNIIPDTAYMEGTFRTFDEQWRTAAKKRIREIAEATAAAYGVTAEVNISDGYPCVVNDEKLVDLSREALTDIFGAESVISLELRPTAEDFGYYTQVYPSVFYRIGVGGEPVAAGCKQEQIAGRLHTPIFNPDEKALEYAVAGLVVLALSLK